MNNTLKKVIAIISSGAIAVSMITVITACTRKNEDKSAYNEEKNNKMINYEYLNNNYCKEGQTVFVGDSITEILNYKELFKDYEKESGLLVYNRGISGDTSNRLLERFEKNVLNIKPKNIVILIGTNDPNYGLTMDETVDNVDKILKLALTECPDTNIILQAVYPVGNDEEKNKNTLELNSRLKVVAENHGVTFLDLTSLLSDENGNLKEEYTYDGLHPTVFGFEVVVKEIIPLLK